MSTPTAKEAGDRVNQLGELHSKGITVKTAEQHRFHVSTDDSGRSRIERSFMPRR